MIDLNHIKIEKKFNIKPDITKEELLDILPSLIEEVTRCFCYSIKDHPIKLVTSKVIDDQTIVISGWLQTQYAHKLVQRNKVDED